MKKILALVLVICLAFTLFVGCQKDENVADNNNETEKNSKNQEEKNENEGNNNEDDSKNDDSSSNMVSEEPVTFTMLYSDNASYPFKEDWTILNEIKRLTNVSLDIQVVPESDYDTKRQIIFNSGKIPDIVTKTNSTDISEYALNGMFLAINDYMDKMPIFSDFLEKYNYQSEIDYITEPDGNFYLLPGKAGIAAENTHNWLARIDVFEKNNIPLPETLDDVYEAGKKLKEIYPDSNPIINRFGSGNILDFMGEGFGTAAGWGLSNSGFMYDEASDSFIFAPGTQNYKDMLIFVNKLYKDGVLDKEFTTLDSTMYEQRVVNSETFILADWVGNEIRYNAAGKELDPDFLVKPIIAPKGPVNYATVRSSRTSSGWAIPSSVVDNENFDELLNFLDWCYTDEAAIAVTFGKEDESYIVNDDGSLDYIEKAKSGEIDYKQAFGVYNGSLTIRVHKDWFMAAKGAETAKLYQEMNELGALKPKLLNPKLSADEKDIEKMYSTVVKDYIDEMTEKYIYGEESFDDYDKFVEECYSKGALELEKLYNESWASQK